MSVPKREIPDYLFDLMESVESGTTAFEVLAAFLITVLKRNRGNRTWTSQELKIPIRTFRNRIWQMESFGIEVPVPENNLGGGFKEYLRKKSVHKFKKKRKNSEL
jgi:hypothetical protein